MRLIRADYPHYRWRGIIAAARRLRPRRFSAPCARLPSVHEHERANIALRCSFFKRISRTESIAPEISLKTFGVESSRDERVEIGFRTSCVCNFFHVHSCGTRTVPSLAQRNSSLTTFQVLSRSQIITARKRKHFLIVVTKNYDLGLAASGAIWHRFNSVVVTVRTDHDMRWRRRCRRNVQRYVCSRRKHAQRNATPLLRRE